MGGKGNPRKKTPGSKQPISEPGTSERLPVNFFGKKTILSESSGNRNPEKDPPVQSGLAFVAGYGIKCYLISQDINQLNSRETGYGPDEAITSNGHIQTAFPLNRLDTAEHLSKLTGRTTINQRAGHPVGMRSGQPSFYHHARSATPSTHAGRMSPDAGLAN
jgi:hypothetical protein